MELPGASADEGEIHIVYGIAYGDGSGPNQHLVLTNRHLNGSSVYLVDALVPQDPAIQILAQKRNERQSTYELDYRQTAAVDSVSRMPWNTSAAWLTSIQFSILFSLGMRHIAEGTDHLLFLLVLLLPAPLLASRSRWDMPAAFRLSLRRILSIVTAFTLDHSFTLSLAAFNAVHIPSRPVEVLIAVSILVSAVHALRPLFPGNEAWIAGFFGLIHGLAFAATLDRLGLTRWDGVAGILAFNLGIEIMQLVVVAAVLPSLILMSQTRVYSLVRIGGAIFGGMASIGWIFERLFDLVMPVDAAMNALAGHAFLIAVNLLVLSLICRLWAHSRALRMYLPKVRGLSID